MSSAEETEVDEGFHSPSVSRTCSEEETTALLAIARSKTLNPAEDGQGERATDCTVGDGRTAVERRDNVSSDHDEGLGPEVTVESRPLCVRPSEKPDDGALDAIRQQSRQLLTGVVSHALGKRVCSAGDPVLQTLLRCCGQLQEQHGSELQSLVRTLRIAGGGRLSAFALVSEELFEGEQRHVTWHRIVALYTFAGLTAKNGQEGVFSDDGRTFVAGISDYVSDAVSPFIRNQGGWSALCSVFPPDEDNSSSLWTLLKWGAVTLGAVTASRIYSN